MLNKILIIGFILFCNAPINAQLKILKNNQISHLESFNVEASDFASEEEMILYMIDNIEKSKSFYYVAGDISAIQNKPTNILNAIHKKILQCMLETSKEISSPYTGIVDAFLSRSAKPSVEYILFLENLLSEDSEMNQEAYLKEIALKAPKSHSELFDLEEKIRIMAAKYLLKFDKSHPLASKYFIEYPIEIRDEPVEHCFVFKENEWSGSGLMGSDGKWLLPPFYQFYEYSHRIISEGKINFFIINGSFPNDLKPVNEPIGFPVSNWVDLKGEWLTKQFVNGATPFFAGVAKFGIADNFKYINHNGQIDSVYTSSTHRILENGYELWKEDDKMVLYNSKKKKLTELPGNFRYFDLLKGDDLIGYADLPGFPGEALAGYINLDGEVLTVPKYMITSDYGYEFPSFDGFEVMAVRDESRKAGLVDKKFKQILPFMYDHVYVKNSKYVYAEIGEQSFLFDYSGKAVDDIDAKSFKSYRTNCKGNYCSSRINNKPVLVDLNGKELSGFEGVEFKKMEHGFIILEKDGLLGAFDSDLNEILPFDNSRIIAMPGNRLVYKNKGPYKCYWLDEDKIYDLPHGFQEEYRKYPSYSSNSEFLKGKIGGKTGIVNAKGEIVVPFELYLPGLYYVQKNN